MSTATRRIQFINRWKLFKSLVTLTYYSQHQSHHERARYNEKKGARWWCSDAASCGNKTHTSS
jgi:hypothetical protein